MKEPIKKYIVPILNHEADASYIKKIGVLNASNLDVNYYIPYSILLVVFCNILYINNILLKINIRT